MKPASLHDQFSPATNNTEMKNSKTEGERRRVAIAGMIRACGQPPTTWIHQICHDTQDDCNGGRFRLNALHQDDDDKTQTIASHQK